METKAQVREQDEARERLREVLKPGDTVHTILRHVSRSGMLRRIDLVKLDGEGDPFYLTRLASKLRGDRTPADNGSGLSMQGAGMDMGLEAVYELAHDLYRETGYRCIGERCPSNLHVNPGPDRNTTNRIHHDGYALRQRWL